MRIPAPPAIADAYTTSNGKNPDASADPTRRQYRPGPAYPPPPGSGFASDTRPPAMFTPDPGEHLAHVRHARDTQGWQEWERAARFARPDAEETR